MRTLSSEVITLKAHTHETHTSTQNRNGGGPSTLRRLILYLLGAQGRRATLPGYTFASSSGILGAGGGGGGRGRFVY